MLHTNSFDFGNLQVLHIIFSFLLLDNEGLHSQVFAYKLRASQAGDDITELFLEWTFKLVHRQTVIQRGDLRLWRLWPVTSFVLPF